MEKKQLTVAELIALLKKMPSVALVCQETDYGYHRTDGVHFDAETGMVFLEAG